jgi:hypothetical protein
MARGETVPGSILDDLDRIEEVPGLKERVEQRRTNGTNPRERARKPSTPPPPYKEGMFVEPLAQMYAMAGMAFLVVGKQNSAMAFMENGHQCAETLDEWARTSPKVRKLLAPLLNAGGAGAVMVAHAPIAFAVVGDMMPTMAEKMADIGARMASAFMPRAQRENAE